LLLLRAKGAKERFCPQQKQGAAKAREKSLSLTFARSKSKGQKLDKKKSLTKAMN
jgi:hypothetical protein